jgi:hypothetical protein
MRVSLSTDKLRKEAIYMFAKRKHGEKVSGEENMNSRNEKLLYSFSLALSPSLFGNSSKKSSVHQSEMHICINHFYFYSLDWVLSSWRRKGEERK